MITTDTRAVGILLGVVWRDLIVTFETAQIQMLPYEMGPSRFTSDLSALNVADEL